MLQASENAIGEFGPVFEHAFDDEPTPNGSDEVKGWGQNYGQKKVQKVDAPKKLSQKVKKTKDIGVDGVGWNVYDTVAENVSEIPEPRSASAFSQKNVGKKTKDIGIDGVGWNVYDTVAENVSEIPEPRAASAFVQAASQVAPKYFGMNVQSQYAIDKYGPALDHE